MTYLARGGGILFLSISPPKTHHWGAFIQKGASIHYNSPFSHTLTLLWIIDVIFVIEMIKYSADSN